jgi:hypothetical protein
VIAVDVRCAGRSEKLPDGFTLPDIAEGLYTLLRALISNGAVDVIGAALGSLAGALLAIPLSGAGARFNDVRGRGRHARTYLAEWANKVWAVGMPGVAEASLVNSFPASHAQQRSAYRGIYLGNDPLPFEPIRTASQCSEAHAIHPSRRPAPAAG